jgi:hypothetical protein
MTVVPDLLAIVAAAQGADWSTMVYLRRFAESLRSRTYHLGHYAFCYRERAEDFRRMAADEKLGVDRSVERATAHMYDDIATLFEKHATPVVCGEQCGFIHDGKEPYGMTKREPCECPCHHPRRAEG